MLTDEILNAFSRTLAQRFAANALGSTPDFDRLVGRRPSDQILAGFLTPRRNRQPLAEDEPSTEEEITQDLPEDEPYEQTNIGIEWLTPVPLNPAGRTLELEVRFSIFVREIPTYNEALENARWQVRRLPNGKEEQYTSIVPVWTRHPFPPIKVSIELDSLGRERSMTFDLAENARVLWEGICGNISGLFPRREHLTIPREDLTEGGYEHWRRGISLTEQSFPWTPVVDARIQTLPDEPSLARLAVRVINQTSNRTTDFFDANLYEIQLTAWVPPSAHRTSLFRELPQSYRYNTTLPAVGINSHIDCDEDQGCIRLTTNTVPTIETPRIIPRDLHEAVPTFTGLAHDPISLLRRIAFEMRRYHDARWQEKVQSLRGSEKREAERDQRDFFNNEILRFERGINVLSRYEAVMHAFRLMNEAMGKVARGWDAWYLFQIVFIVSQIPSLAARHYKELHSPNDDYVDILWFPAGGGKTEAFLGLIVWQAFFDRIRGKRLGVTAIVRFPLRLLTFQQLQRVSRTLAVADQIREREHLGGQRFSLGYMVGSDTTPNNIDSDLHNALVQANEDWLNERYRRLIRCPFCQEKTVSMNYDRQCRRLEHRCTTTSCPNHGKSIPLYIVDDDVYFLLPTIIVSTVDKLAGIGQNQRFTNLFGRITSFCHRHGASFLDGNWHCEAAKDSQLEVCGNVPVERGPFHDLSPSMLIQDELHLLREELGTFDAHYETATMVIQKSLAATPWKIIAASATIEGFEDHAKHLYLRNSRRFPGPGPTATESFYAISDERKIGRLFIGLLGVARKHTPAVTKTLALVYRELEEARQLANADLNGALGRLNLPKITLDEFIELLFRYEIALTYVLTRKGSDQVSEAIESKVKEEVQETFPGCEEIMVATFNSGVDMRGMIGTMDRIETATLDTPIVDRIRGVVATNIISHGVDIERFNIIVFAGLPRQIAEYIQASARVGRLSPGISIFVVTPQNERDRSVFDRFGKFHEYLDRLVEPSAINRWTLPALGRTVPGLLSAYLMGPAAARIGRRLYSTESVQDARGGPEGQVLTADVVVGWMHEALSSNTAPSPDRYRNQVDSETRKNYALIVNSARSTDPRNPTNLNRRLEPMRSLRDVDEPADIVLEDAEDQIMLTRLKRIPG